ncbi:MAG: DNA polymerase III subunit beta [Candidatus Paceibacterota bacterium]|jgi:DNA polymerase-3 subunit beta
MKFTTLVETLKKAVNSAEKITGKNLTLPVLSNILFKTNTNKLHVLATDLEIGIELIVTGKTETEGEFVIPAKTFADFLNNLSEETINLEKKNETLVVKSGKYNTVFQGLNPEEFPIIPEAKTDKYIELEKADLIETLEQVLPSIGYNSPKPELNGVFLKLEISQNDNILKLVGTDSFRLAEKTVSSSKIKTNIKNDIEVIIPLRTAQELLRLMEENIENEGFSIRIAPESNQIQFSFSNIRLVSRLINADYPKYSSIIPNNFENKAIFNKKELIEAVKIIGLFSGKVNDIKFHFNPSKKEIVLEAQDPSLGKSQTTLTPIEMSGNSLQISFNHRFFLDGLNSVKEDEVFVGLNKESNPGLIRGEKDDNFVYILMPIKL